MEAWTSFSAVCIRLYERAGTEPLVSQSLCLCMYSVRACVEVCIRVYVETECFFSCAHVVFGLS